MRRAEREHWNCTFTVYSRNALSQQLCRRKFPKARYILGDIRDTQLLRVALTGHETVIHTAAFKHVVEAEHNVSETIAVNVGGSQSLLDAARDASVSRIIGISTDKAVDPHSVYGLSKALMERLFGEAVSLAQYARTYEPLCVLCRYGNVVGSTGSIVTVFQEQLARDKHLTLTDPKMTRYYMSADEAVDLILYAALQGKTGHIYIPTKIRALALDRLVNYVFPTGVAKEYIGRRPGENMHEKLLSPIEGMWVLPSKNTQYLELPTPLQRIRATDRVGMTLSSESAEEMTQDDFLQLIADAVTI